MDLRLILRTNRAPPARHVRIARQALGVVAATHLAFFETMAGVIPIVFLALVVEERVAPNAETVLDHVLPVVSAGFLFVGEALALLAVWRGHASSGLAAGVSTAAAVGAFLLLGDATVGRAEKIEDRVLRRRVGKLAGVVLLLVVGIVLTVALTAR
jgi:hypothetical protein